MSDVQHLEKMIYVSPESIERFEACRFSSYSKVLVKQPERYPEREPDWFYWCRSRLGLLNPQISCLYCPAFRFRKKGER